jgi:hypothetical protein
MTMDGNRRREYRLYLERLGVGLCRDRDHGWLLMRRAGPRGSWIVWRRLFGAREGYR